MTDEFETKIRPLAVSDARSMFEELQDMRIYTFSVMSDRLRTSNSCKSVIGSSVGEHRRDLV